MTLLLRPTHPLRTPLERDGLSVLDAALVGAGLAGAFRRGEGSDARSRRAVEQIILDGRAVLGRVAGRLIAGVSTVPEWAAATFRRVAAGCAAAVMALRWEPFITPADAGPLARAAAGQHAYLVKFAAQVAAGSVPLGPGLVARAKSYAHSAWAAGYAVLLAGARPRGFTHARRTLGIADHCNQCVHLARLGWLPLHLVTPIGRTECSYGCHCTLSFR